MSVLWWYLRLFWRAFLWRDYDDERVQRIVRERLPVINGGVRPTADMIDVDAWLEWGNENLSPGEQECLERAVAADRAREAGSGAAG